MTKTKPQLRFNGFTDAWEKRKLGELLKTESSKQYINEPNDGEYPIIQQGDNPVLGYSDKTPFPNFKSVVLFGDHTLSLFKPITPFLVATDGIKILSSENLVRNFHYIFLQKYKPESQGYKRHFSILKNEIGSFPIHIEEQKKIGAFFKKIDYIIHLQQRKLELLKIQKKGFLQKMFPKKDSVVPELRFKGFTGTWEQLKLKDLGDTFTGLSGKTKEDFGHGQAKFVTYVNVYTNSISNLSMTENVEIDEKQNQVKYGDIFFTTSSETPEEVGMSSVWLGKEDNVYLNSFCFGYRPTAELEPYYAAFMLRSFEVRKKFILLAQGISRYNISKTKAMEMFVPYPSFEEQQKIGSFFKQLDETIDLQERKLESLKEQKKGFLQKMFV